MSLYYVKRNKMRVYSNPIYCKILIHFYFIFFPLFSYANFFSLFLFLFTLFNFPNRFSFSLSLFIIFFNYKCLVKNKICNIIDVFICLFVKREKYIIKMYRSNLDLRPGFNFKASSIFFCVISYRFLNYLY